MRTLKLEFHKKKCIGAFTCIRIAPEFFKEEGTKATLVEKDNSEKSEAYETRTIECDEKTTKKLIEAAENCPVNVINIIDATDVNNEENIVDSKLRTSNNYKEIEAEYDDTKEFVLDEKGYFLIRILPEKKMIEVGFCGKRNEVEVKISGRTPIEIYQTILREKIIERADHAAYLGRELQKAYTALQLGIKYVQDDELKFK